MNMYNRKGSVRIGAAYGVDDRGVVVRVPVVSRIIYFFTSSYQMGIGGSLWG
jgi:hypothetical protein